MKPYENELIKGVSLEGTVLDVSLDHLKVHLDIDPEQSVEEAFWYPSKAEAISERINLYITGSEETGLIMTCIRGTEGTMATISSMSKPTEIHGNEMGYATGFA